MESISAYGFALAGMNAFFIYRLNVYPLVLRLLLIYWPIKCGLYHARQKYDFVWVTFAIIG
jgi:inner membrane transporter RhtA